MGNIVLKVALILVILSVLAWALQKLFPPTQKDREQAEHRAKELEERFRAEAETETETVTDTPAPADGESTGQTEKRGL